MWSSFIVYITNVVAKAVSSFPVVAVSISTDAYAFTALSVSPNTTELRIGTAVIVLVISCLLLATTSIYAFRQGASSSSSRPSTTQKRPYTVPRINRFIGRSDSHDSSISFDPTLADADNTTEVQTEYQLRRVVKEMWQGAKSTFEERQEYVKKLLEDLSESFIDDGGEIRNDIKPNERGSIVIEERTRSVSSKSTPQQKVTTHFCFLVHGLNGTPHDLSYLQSAMVQSACNSLQGASEQVSDDESTSVQENDDSKRQGYEQPFKNRIILHNCECNTRNTGDGIESGGQRLLGEMLNVVRSSVNDHYRCKKGMDKTKVTKVTISMIGNSLGGIYSRYAIAKLAEMSSEDDSILIDGKIRINFNIFCTTATPHLGIASHTYFPLPRTAEIGLGKVMGQTLADLFRITPILRQMCTCPTYLRPLASFRQRILYANSHGDFPVPTQTAAFLNSQSTYPHHISPRSPAARMDETDSRKDFVVATLHTPCATEKAIQRNPNSIVKKSSTAPIDSNEELLDMSQSLDQLGWKKVFVKMPISVNVPIPRLRKRRESKGLSSFSSLHGESIHSSDSEDMKEQSQTCSSSCEGPEEDKEITGILESRDVTDAVSSPDSVHLPFAHNMMVAFARGKMSRAAFKAGRPLMNDLAEEIVPAILDWK